MPIWVGIAEPLVWRPVSAHVKGGALMIAVLVKANQIPAGTLRCGRNLHKGGGFAIAVIIGTEQVGLSVAIDITRR